MGVPCICVRSIPPRWKPRARQGQFLGHSTVHSSSISLIRNLNTGSITPQYHVVYDDEYFTVPNYDSPAIGDTFDPSTWSRLIKSGLENYLDNLTDLERRAIPPVSRE